VSAAFNKGPGPAWDPDEEITLERRVRFPASFDDGASTRRTTEMRRVDSRLLAIARGELEPEDPFGGLIPIYDEGPAQEIQDDWLVLEPEPDPESGPSAATETLFEAFTPHLRLTDEEVMVLPIGDRTAFFLSQVDGRRSVQQLAVACAMDDLEALEITDELMRMGVIVLR
jgi:hypothetical protein